MAKFLPYGGLDMARVREKTREQGQCLFRKPKISSAVFRCLTYRHVTGFFSIAIANYASASRSEQAYD